MKYYQEIRLLPDVEISVYFLWAKVFAKVHASLAGYKERNGQSPIGISIPGYTEKGLGDRLRIMASEKVMLEELNLQKQLQHLADYVHLTSVRPIPQRRIQGYSVYSRYQPDEPVARKARRFSKRHEEVSYEEALSLLQSRKEDYRLPFIQMQSGSTKQVFHLFIQKKNANGLQEGFFTTYGLSHTASVPEF